MNNLGERTASLETEMVDVKKFVDSSREFQTRVLEILSRMDEREKKRERTRTIIRTAIIGILGSALGFFGKHWKW